MQTFASLGNNIASDKVFKKNLIIPVVFFLGAIVPAAVPRLTWLFLLLTALALIVPVLRRGRWHELVRPDPTLIALLVFVAYVFASAAWAADRGVALSTATPLLAVILITFAACRALQQSDQQQLRSATIAFAAGAFLGALFVTFELLTDGALTRAITDTTTMMKVNPKDFHISDGHITRMNPSFLNRNVAIVMFNLWPGLLALRTLARGTYRVALTGLLLAATAIAVMMSEHKSSQLALIASVPAFWLAWAWRTLAIRVLAILWCAAFVLVLPMDFVAYKADLHKAEWMPASFRARVIIWEYTAERVFEHPWFGIGANCTHVLAKPGRDVSDQPEGFVYPRTTGWHAHDLFLQTWYELGLLGAILIAAAGVVLVTRMTLLQVESQPFAVASFTVFFVIAAFAWGMWQQWLMCAIGLLVLYFQTAARAASGEHRTESEARTLS